MFNSLKEKFRSKSSSTPDLNIDAPNPVNPNPQGNDDCPIPKNSDTNIQEMPLSSTNPESTSVFNRPPRSPGPALGPYFQFLGTDLKEKRWLGSVLICRDVSFDRPKFELISGLKIELNWEVLYENLFGMRIYRIDMSIELRDGQGDDEIIWKIDWGKEESEGLFRIARLEQNWRGAFFSCNGFDATVSEQRKAKLNFGHVWEHLNSVHETTSLHILIWGGDQTYLDFVFEDVPYLREWTQMQWNEKWTCDFRDDLRQQVERYYFNTYLENWERPEVRKALASVPSIMMWDDHDIFDGAGSYPKLLHDSPMMTGLFRTAQKMRLLFQHHTTVEKAHQRNLFGYRSFNYIIRCGPHLAILGADGRSERTMEVVHHQQTWKMIFNELESKVDGASHLIVLFPVPFSFLRLKLAESVFDHLKTLSTRCRNVGLVKETNSIFGLPELYDDLLDEWTHEVHIQERNSALQRFQEFSRTKRIRVTFFSGDVHCCGISRFRTRTKRKLNAIHDEKLMYQVIASAIVNLPPPKTAIRLGHYFKTKWNPIAQTREELIDFFHRAPEDGRRLLHKKLLPNRNWCFFEICQEMYPTIQTAVKTGFIHRNLAKAKSSSTPSNLHNKSESLDGSLTWIDSVESLPTVQKSQNLKIRLWLESDRIHRREREFVHYDLMVPYLE